MTSRNGFSYVFVCWLMLVMAACRGGADTPVSKTVIPVEVLASGGQCFPAPAGWTATRISSPKQFEEMLSKCRSNRIGPVAETMPPVDFDRFVVLAVEMGEQRSAGYGFDTGEVTATVGKGMATVNLVYHKPPPDAKTAQVMTAPWILIRMPLGGYDGIRVMGSDGRTLTRISLP